MKFKIFKDKNDGSDVSFLKFSKFMIVSEEMKIHGGFLDQSSC